MNRIRSVAVFAAAIAAFTGAAGAAGAAGVMGATASGATTVSGATSTSTATTTRCAESQLRAGVRTNDIAGLKRHVLKVTFTNTSRSACTLTGYPGAAIVDDAGKQVVQAKRTFGGPVGGTIEKPTTLTVRAGATAYAWLEGSSTRERGAAQAGCDGARYPRILITPPNTDNPVGFTIGWPQCYSFAIHPVRED